MPISPELLDLAMELYYAGELSSLAETAAYAKQLLPELQDYAAEWDAACTLAAQDHQSRQLTCVIETTTNLLTSLGAPQTQAESIIIDIAHRALNTARSHVVHATEHRQAGNTG